MDFEVAFVRAGGTLLAGLDPTGSGGAIAGCGDEREVELLVEASFTPLEAIRRMALPKNLIDSVNGMVGSS
jgi:hypothetical protein